MKKGLCIIVPCFNEADRIKYDFFESSLKTIDSIVFVNDGSTDHTAEVLEDISQRISESGGKSYVAHLQINQGKGAAVRAGLLEALAISDASYFAIMDADNSAPITEIVRLKDVAEQEEVSIVQGARVALSGKEIRRSSIRHYVGRVSAALVSVILGLKIYDTQAGAKVFSRSVVPILFDKEFISRWLFDCEVFLRAQRSNLDVFEEPLQVWCHVSSGTSVGPHSYIRSLVDLIKIRLKERGGEK